jgi:hypothetical protein
LTLVILVASIPIVLFQFINTQRLLSGLFASDFNGSLLFDKRFCFFQQRLLPFLLSYYLIIKGETYVFVVNMIYFKNPLFNYRLNLGPM